MDCFVALLRGVNVGKAKRVPMVELRAILSGLGYVQVRTLLNSGNAVFHSTELSTATHAKQIQTAIAQSLNIEVPVIVKSKKQMTAIVADNSFLTFATDPSRLLVGFTGEEKALEDLAVLNSLVKEPEHLKLGKHSLYLWCANGILESQVAKALVGKVGRGVTTRNWATVVKLLSLMEQEVT